jgi:hypothetical protein
MQNYWLSVWANAVAAWPAPTAAQEDVEPFPVVYYMSTYFGIGLAAIVVQLFATFVLVVATLNASQVLALPPSSIHTSNTRDVVSNSFALTGFLIRVGGAGTRKWLWFAVEHTCCLESNKLELL